MQRLTLELPEPLYQQLTRIAELTSQSLEALALQSITGNLPPSVENAPLEMQAELSQMQALSIDRLLEIAQSQIAIAQVERHHLLLERNQLGEISVEEQQELRNLGLAADRMMLKKAFAWSVLRWRGYAMPTLDELPPEE
ncbi:hypothetical protein V2H45_16365 [Tumidithrix elongata RA019]|uniref:Uncharacterized protein n=1 Tax=Tumidithrix elongata BACA0141 TaxID=2716417 RepID=A0AAW9Q4E7_9CYAN|nr:hypothetical protein [Tumidithrix elongata RA019]